MRLGTITPLILALTLISGCGQQDDAPTVAAASEETQATAQMTPERLGELGARIEREPERADELLNEHGLTRESFETAIRKVTEEPEASKRYAQAYQNAKA